MHRCLHISELLSRICEELASSTSPAHVLPLALVSKSFHEPALDVLWGTLHSMVPLLKVLPQDLWYEDGEPVNLRFRGSLVAADIDRFRYYSKRVRNMFFLRSIHAPKDFATSITIDPSCFIALICAFDIFHRGENLLPNLHSITCQDTESWDVYYILSARLKYFALNFDGSCSVSTLTALSALAIKSPLLEHILIMGGHNNKVTSALSVSITRMKNLRYAQVMWVEVTGEMLAYLACLPRLYSMACEVTDTEDNHATLYPSTKIPLNPFRALRSLTLFGTRFSSLAEFIRVFLYSSPLALLTILLSGDEWETPLELLRTLANRSSSGNLRDLDLSHIEVHTTGLPPSLTPREISPLLSCTGLVQFTCNLYCSTEQFDDSLLEAMAGAWPKLQTLQLTPAPGRQPSRCTLRGILHLARRCPDLKKLGIIFTASKQIAWEGRPGGGIVGNNLTSLNVGCSPLTPSAAKGVASFLSDVFPNLTDITAWKVRGRDLPGDAPNRAIWDKMYEFYREFVQIRREERA